MTTITHTISNNQYWNNISSNQSLDFDDLFSSLFDFIHHDEYNQNLQMIKEGSEDISSSDIDQEILQTSSIDNSSQESNLLNLVCGVCGAPAHGFNFDQITCESCKTFFRRNALRNMPQLKCRFSGSCIINVHTRRLCTYCRLKKCFDIKMRKDWIRTDEEKELRKLQKLIKEQKKLNKDQQSFINLPLVERKKKRLMKEFIIKPIYKQIFFGFNRNLSNEDQVLLNNITNAYQLAANQADGFRLDKYQPISVIQFINNENTMHESLIYFYKYIPQFKQLDIKDQVLLIKSNMMKIVPLHYILIQKFQESPLIGIYMSKWINEDFHYQMFRTRQYFYRFIEHPLIIKLALIVLIFSINLSTSRCINLSEDYINRMNISEIQELYTTILWRYLNHLFGEKEAIRSMVMITTQIVRFQSLTDIMEETIIRQTDCNSFNELLPSLLRLT